MADIDHIAFARAVSAALRKRRLSYATAVAKWPTLNKAMLSRACNGHPLSAGNHLVVCRELKLDAYRFLVEERLTIKGLTEKHVRKQAVTSVDPRETRRGIQ